MIFNELADASELKNLPIDDNMHGIIEEEEMDELMENLFAIFYVDDAYIASRDPAFLQQAIDGLVSAFERVGLETNTKKTQAMTCTPGTIRLQLPTESYLRMRTGRTPAADWDARTVTCRECGKEMRASSLSRHLADLHQIYQQQVVANAQVLVEDTGSELRFLHRVVNGGANRSYGIEAARLAGVPPAVVLRARQVLGRIEANSYVAVA